MRAETKLKQEPVADGGGLPELDVHEKAAQLWQDAVDAERISLRETMTDEDALFLCKTMVGRRLQEHVLELEAAYASSQEALRLARELIEEYRESHINSRRPCVESATCSTCQEAIKLLSPEGSSR